MTRQIIRLTQKIGPGDEANQELPGRAVISDIYTHGIQSCMLSRQLCPLSELMVMYCIVQIFVTLIFMDFENWVAFTKICFAKFCIA